MVPLPLKLKLATRVFLLPFIPPCICSPYNCYNEYFEPIDGDVSIDSTIATASSAWVLNERLF